MNGLYNKILMRTIKIEHGKPVLLNKVDFVMFPARAMAKFVQKIGEDLGDDYIYKLGYDAGMMVGEEFVEKLGWIGLGVARKMGMIFKMFEVMGFGKVDIKVWDTKNYRLLYRKTNHPVIEHATRLFGKKSKICMFYMGIEAAHWHNEMGVKNCKLSESKCLTKGSPYCEYSYNYLKSAEEKSVKKK